MSMKKRLENLEQRRTVDTNVRPYAILSNEQLRAIIDNAPDDVSTAYTRLSDAELIAIVKDADE